MRINRLASALVAAFALLVAVPAALAAEPQAYKLGDLEISGGFARATLPNAPVGGGFLTITNHGATDDRLVSAASPLAPPRAVAADGPPGRPPLITVKAISEASARMPTAHQMALV